MLDEIISLKYQITVKVLLSKQKKNGGTEIAPVCVKSATKLVIILKYDLYTSFQEILYRINNWINEGSSWVIESLDAEYVNISIFSPLSWSIYIESPRRLRNSMKSLIRIKK